MKDLLHRYGKHLWLIPWLTLTIAAWPLEMWRFAVVVLSACALIYLTGRKW